MDVIDNINRLLGDDLKCAMVSDAKVRIAASCFSIYAFEALKTELASIEGLQFLFTSPTFLPNQVTDKLKKERREFHLPKLRRENSLYGTEFEIRLKNELTQKAIAKECAAWIRSKAQFRTNTSDAPMQQFACVTHGCQSSVYMPLHGFTAVDLGYQRGNAVSNIVTRMDEVPATSTFLALFDQIWRDTNKTEDITAQLCEHIAAVYNENSPDTVYFLMLYHIFSEFLADVTEDVLPNDLTGYQDSMVWKKLFNFQRDAAGGIINKLETFNGCILADSVGLGKTFTALAVIKYYELRNKSVLILCPKKLADNWLTYNQNLVTNIFAKDRFNYTVLCHTDLQRDGGMSLGVQLNKINWGNFDLVVIDESHNFRNNNAFKDRETRYQRLMERVIKSGVKTKVLMLSATPVNNRFSDLRNQLALAYEGESENLSKKLKTTKEIEEIFRRAQAAFNIWSELPPDKRTPAEILSSLDFDFFELLDSVTIARSRKHIQKYYDTKEIGSFPERLKPVSLQCPLTDRADVVGYNAIFTRLMGMEMAVYKPFAYILDSRLANYEAQYDTLVQGGISRLKQADREQSLQTLMTINLLKRLESSVAAFRITLKTLRDNLNGVLKQIDVFKKTGHAEAIDDRASAYSAEEEDEDSGEEEASCIGKKIKIDLADMDLSRWKADLDRDRAVILELLSEMEKVTPRDDTKLLRLKELIQNKVSHPLNPGNRKILIFTAFADTARYLYENLAQPLHTAQGIHVALITGAGDNACTLRKSADYQTLLTLFSPISKERAVVFPKETGEIDILIGTDCISEGQNLQDCDYLVNYDIHWNPVRIIQRFGRIDRIGSRNRQIQLVNFWPDMTLDEYINLKERVENRMVIVDVTATGDENVLSAKANDLAFRKEQLQRLRDEVIDLDDVKAGVSITDLGLNDFRMDLVNFIKANGAMENVPKGMHAIAPAVPEKGILPGVIFALRNTHNGLRNNTQNRLHPFYLVYVGMDGRIIANHEEVKRVLDLLRTASRDKSEPIPALYHPFNEETHDGRRMETYSHLLEQGIRSMIAVKEEKDIDSLFSGGGTTALQNPIRGLDDFELIAFLVIRESSASSVPNSASSVPL